MGATGSWPGCKWTNGPALRWGRGMFLTDSLATQVGTFALVPQVVDAVKVPVIAAGSIADARGIVAAFALGASGVQLGTAYLHCPESKIAPQFPLAGGALAPLRAKAEAEGSTDFSPMWAGAAAALGRSMPAAELTRT